MKALKTILLAGGALVVMAADAQAADIPTKKAAPAPAPVCFNDFWSYLNTSPADCPLRIPGAGITVTGRADWGVSAETNGASFNYRGPDAIAPVISNVAKGAKFELAPGMMGQSFVSLKGVWPVGGDVKLIAEWSIAFDPYTMQLGDGEGADIDNNWHTAALRPSTPGSSSYGGQWDNRLGYVGVQSDTFGTVKVGRLMTFMNELAGQYDPTGGSYGFSLLGYSGNLSSGFGVTETNRYNLGGSYLWDNKTFHLGGETQFGGYNVGNDAEYMYQFDAGAKIGDLNIDGIYAHATDALALNMFSAQPAGNFGFVSTPNDLTATVTNYDAFAVMARYKIQQFTIFGGYLHTDMSNPTDSYYTGGVNNVLWSQANVISNTYLPGSITSTGFPQDKILQHVWIGGKYSFSPSFDLMAGYWHVWQNYFDTNSAVTQAADCATAANGVGTVSSKCNGTEDAFSISAIWRPVKRIDVYGGVIYSQVNGGIASGYQVNNNTSFNGGIRLNF